MQEGSGADLRPRPMSRNGMDPRQSFRAAEAIPRYHLFHDLHTGLRNMLVGTLLMGRSAACSIMLVRFFSFAGPLIYPAASHHYVLFAPKPLRFSSYKATQATPIFLADLVTSTTRQERNMAKALIGPKPHFHEMEPGYGAGSLIWPSHVRWNRPELRSCLVEGFTYASPVLIQGFCCSRARFNATANSHSFNSASRCL